VCEIGKTAVETFEMLNAEFFDQTLSCLQRFTGFLPMMIAKYPFMMLHT
jgi:hypothetical protein